jgi:hypothetical protein
LLQALSRLQLWLCHGFTGIAAIDDVSSGAIVDLSTSILLFAIAPAVDVCYRSGCRWLVTPLLSFNRGPLPLAFAILLACLFSCHDGALYWTLSVLSSPWLIPTLLQSMPREV